MREGDQAVPGGSTLDRLMSEADALYRYALSRVRHHHTAQDLVQDTLVTACQKIGEFEGRSALGTWLTGILRNKILTHFRNVERHPEVLVAGSSGSGEVDPLNAWFTDYGSWKVDPNAGLGWLDADPHELVERAEVREAVQRCVDHLPGGLRRLFVLREMEDWGTEEICSSTRITRGSLAVLLHRARQLLRACLQKVGLKP